MATAKSKRTCPQGHVYHKRSDCPVCPVCAGAEQRADFRDRLGAPARRAIETAGISSLEQLSGWTKADLLKLHGLGPASIPVLEAALREAGMAFSS